MVNVGSEVMGILVVSIFSLLEQTKSLVESEKKGLLWRFVEAREQMK